ncbi:hypothetical protein VTK73DRAFT_5479 [Phialemonium thermophilum]|uniref:Uncharacterized protein n=1 Tax=Phialemonium thermophilum TaxID=223376 RepID=A0ABR3WP08_9PEZI
MKLTCLQKDASPLAGGRSGKRKPHIRPSLKPLVPAAGPFCLSRIIVVCMEWAKVCRNGVFPSCHWGSKVCRCSENGWGTRRDLGGLNWVESRYVHSKNSQPEDQRRWLDSHLVLRRCNQSQECIILLDEISQACSSPYAAPIHRKHVPTRGLKNNRAPHERESK